LYIYKQLVLAYRLIRNIHALFEPKIAEDPHGYCVHAFATTLSP
jgi:hypothetical protein